MQSPFLVHDTPIAPSLLQSQAMFINCFENNYNQSKKNLHWQPLGWARLKYPFLQRSHFVPSTFFLQVQSPPSFSHSLVLFIPSLSQLQAEKIENYTKIYAIIKNLRSAPSFITAIII